MAQYDSAENVSLHSASNCPALAVCWLLGIICGVILFLHAGTTVVSLMRGIPCGSVSIVGLFAIGLIPFLFTAYAVFIYKPRLILAIAFCKAFLFSFVSMGISVAFASAGWLMRSLLLFSGSIWCVILYLLWIRILSGRKACWLAASAAGIVVSCIAFYIMSPFLACLIDL